MIKQFACKTVLIVSVCLLSSCADVWSEHAPDGTPLNVARAECRAQAIASARDQLPFGFDDHPYPGEFPPDTIQSIEARETALCLKQRGFTLKRE